ncbi:MAG: hypothetical protein HGB04_02210 [Chlorobiaceae bacterium]|nr:hypothetical protein [Chlorobiaceae bacterium]
MITAPVSSPTLFATQGLPAYVKGFPLLMTNFYSIAHHDVAIGKSHGTKIIYNYSDVPERPERKDRKVSFTFNGVAEGELIGSLTIQSRKNSADEVDMQTLIHDATSYIRESGALKGYNITLLSSPSTINFMTGVDTRTNGLAASSFVSGFFNAPVGVIAGLVPSIAKSGGVTVPTAVIGCTFLVLVDGEHSRRVDIRQNYTPSNTPQEPKGDASNSNGKNNDTVSQSVAAAAGKS